MKTKIGEIQMFFFCTETQRSPPCTHPRQLSAGHRGAERIRLSVALGTKQIHAGAGGGGAAEQIVGRTGAGDTGGKRVGGGRRRARGVVQLGAEGVGFRWPGATAAGTEGVAGAGEGVLGRLGEEGVRGERVGAFEGVLPERI